MTKRKLSQEQIDRLEDHKSENARGKNAGD